MLNNEGLAVSSVLQRDDEGGEFAGVPFIVVGIGASAGGLEAFTQLLNNLAVDTGMAFVLVQHLDPAHESQLSEILARTTTMPVQQITESIKIEPNSVYVIPPNSNVTLSGNVFHLTPRIAHTVNLPIDCLFESLAVEQRRNSVGVVLSGTGTDGTAGLKAIKSVGGITFVQTASSAKSAAMPQSAGADGSADFVLSAAEIAQELSLIGWHPYVAQLRPKKVLSPPANEQDALRKIFQSVQAASGVDFSHYKQTTARRRIERRVVVTRSHTIGEYARYLDAHPEEIQNLYRDLLISVTHFFRDPEAFDALTTHLAEALKKTGTKSLFRVWVPGCATGEEVYSLAICLDELFSQEGIHPILQIFGTDISDGALSAARVGSYPDTIQQDVSDERLHRYFHKIDGHYQINKAIRDFCVFAKQDLTNDPPFSRVDLISCRNTLIYLDDSLQKKVLSTFHYSLLDGGVMFLGTAELPGDSPGLFQAVNSKYKIYTRNSEASATSISYPVRRQDSSYPPPRSAPPPTPQDWRKQADQLVRDRYSPAGVIINQEMTIMEVRGRTGYYLKSPAIGATKNLLLLAHDDLQQPLREAALSAIAKNVPVERKGLHLAYHGEARDINLEVIPLSPASAKERFYFVVLGRTDASALTEDDRRKPVANSPTTTEQVIFQLTQQNTDLSDLVRSLSRDFDRALEEQKASNEEICTANEELQSTNEELSTAKEELQSANEELTTVNEQLRNRTQELSILNGDLNNVLSAVNTPILMLDRGLLLRRFTPAAEQRFNLSAADLGRGVSQVPKWLHVPSLQQMVHLVLETLAIQTKEIQDDEGCWWSLTVWPYLTVDRRIEGAVLTFSNIDVLKRSLHVAEAGRKYAMEIVDSVREPLLVLDGQLRVITASRAFCQTFAVSPDDTLGKFVYDIGAGQWNIPSLKNLLDQLTHENKSFHDYEVNHDFPGLGPRDLLLNARQLRTEKDRVDLILLAIDDVTERKRSRERLEASNEDLQRFAYAAAHDLRSPLNSSLRVSQILAEGLKGKLDDYESSMLKLFVESMERLRTLMEDILTYSGIGYAPQQLVAMSLEEPLKIALANLQPTIEVSGAKIVFGAMPGVTADRTQVARVFQNLIDNAIKYCSEKTPKVEIAATRNGSHWQISVTDNGQGFKAENAAKIFEPFKRLSESDVPGSGIGLATCKRIVERLGGRIWAKSVPGAGSSFYFTLPAEQASAAGAG